MSFTATLRVRPKYAEPKPPPPLVVPPHSCIADFPDYLEVNRTRDTLEWRFSYKAPEAFGDRGERALAIDDESPEGAGSHVTLSMRQGTRTGRVYEFTVTGTEAFGIDAVLPELENLTEKLLLQPSTREVRASDRSVENQKFLRNVIAAFVRRELAPGAAVPTPNLATWSKM